jgi:hypothetical protein
LTWTSQFHVNMRPPTTDTMTFRTIGVGHTCGEAMRILSWIAPDGTWPPRNAMGWDPHLRSTDEVTGYHLVALDGEIGHVDDFIIDDETWAIRYLVVATRNWWPGKKVLISPKWIESVSWEEQGSCNRTYLARPSRPRRNTPTSLCSHGITKRACMGTTIVKDTGSTNSRPFECSSTSYESCSSLSAGNYDGVERPALDA